MRLPGDAVILSTQNFLLLQVREKGRRKKTIEAHTTRVQRLLHTQVNVGAWIHELKVPHNERLCSRASFVFLFVSSGSTVAAEQTEAAGRRKGGRGPSKLFWESPPCCDLKHFSISHGQQPVQTRLPALKHVQQILATNVWRCHWCLSVASHAEALRVRLKVHESPISNQHLLWHFFFKRIVHPQSEFQSCPSTDYFL